MQKLFLSLLISAFSLFSFAQQNEAVKKLVSEGIVLHDKGDYDAAVKKYDEALAIDKKDYDANYEKAYSLYLAKRYDECITVSQFIIDQFPDADQNKGVYSTYGCALDDKGEKEKAIKIYDKGIKKYPGHSLLYFNKGLTQERLDEPEDALVSYQQALKYKPLHPSSSLFIGRILQYSNKIPALMAIVVFLAVEPQGERATQALKRIDQIIYGNMKKDSGKATTIYIDAGLFGDSKKKGKEDNFSSIEMAFSLMGSLDDASGMEKIAKTKVDKFSFKLQMLTNALSNDKKDGKGFYWKFYAQFLIDVKEKDMMETLAHIVYANSNDEDNNKWIADNKDKTSEFYNWLKSYKWSVE